ncbi:MAG: glycosyltransferase family 4 protein [Chitinophagaceae bacterium]|nr:glycosyltransferase family 4 protein [Chitinophagaceae bacterium]
MTIAVNTRFLLTGYLEGYGYFIYETFKRITASHPEHEFIFIFDRPYDEKFVFGKNVKPVVAGPPARHPLLWKYWYDIKIPAILRKYKADVFVSCDGFCSLRTKVPQCLVVHDLAFLHYPSFNKRSHVSFLKRNMSKFLEKAGSVATVSEFSRKDILANYKAGNDKIDIVFSAAKEIFRPVTEEDKTATKNKHTEGKEYFVYAGAIHPRKNLMNLLKAFSVLKKRMQTNMKLVLAGRLAWKYESFIESLNSYKYRNDVVITGYVAEEELVKIIGSAYGMIYPSFLEGFGVPVLEAMQCSVPVITSINSSMQEIAKEAALYVNPEDHNDIADKMMLLYKDETLKKELVEKGKIVSKEYSWDRTSDLLWQSILKTVGKTESRKDRK